MATIDKDRAILRIDASKLPEQVADHSDLYYDHAVELAEMRSDRDDLARERSVIEADLDSSIRLSPEKWGLEKVTDKGVGAAIKQDKDIIKFTDKIARLERAIGRKSALVVAMEHRKKMLELATDLFLSSFHASPKTEAYEKPQRRTR